MERTSGKISSSFKGKIPEKYYGFIVIDRRFLICAKIIANKLHIISKKEVKNSRLNLVGLSSQGIHVISVPQIGIDIDLWKEFGQGCLGFTLATTTDMVPDRDSLFYDACAFYFGDGCKKMTVVVMHGGEVGLHEAIKLSPFMNQTRFMEEILILKDFFKLVSNGRCKVGVEESIESLTDGRRRVDTLIVSDGLLVKRYVIRLFNSSDVITVYERPGKEVDFEIEEESLLLDWIANAAQNFHCKVIEYVGSTSNVGHQFLKGLGGIGVILIDGAKEDDDIDADDVEEDDNGDADDVEEDDELNWV